MISIKVFISLRSLKKKKEDMEQVDPVVPYDFFSQLLCVSQVVVLAHPTVIALIAVLHSAAPSPPSVVCSVC